MNIPLDQSSSDIYDLGFDRGLNREIPDNSTGVVYDTIENATNAASVLSGGNLNLKTLTIGGLTRQVAPGDDIQAAIDAVNREGGGTVQLLAKTYNPTFDINLKSNVALVGAGRDVTILDFVGAPYGVKASGTASDIRQNFSISNLTIQGADVPLSTGGLEVKFADFFAVENVRVHNTGSNGVFISNCQFFRCSNVRSSSNSDGFIIDSQTNTSRDTSDFLMLNCLADSNTSSGFQLQRGSSASSIIRKYAFINCSAKSSGNNGFLFISNAASSDTDGIFLGCNASNNTQDGFDLNTSNLSEVSFIGCVARDNVVNGFNVVGNFLKFVGCSAIDNGTNWAVSGATTNNVTIIGCEFVDDDSTASSSAFSVTGKPFLQSFGNIGGSPVTERVVLRMKNSSGATIPQGGVVVFSSDSAADVITTTNTNGDTKVFGIGLSGTYGNTQYEPILAQGITSSLMVTNGTSSISIGDWLSTYSHAYYAKKATDGETVFAIALEAPTTGTAAIGALLVSPRTLPVSSSSPISGTYTPTLTNVANLDGNGTGEFQYSRVGNTVSVSGAVGVNPTTTATSTQLGISLPIASNFGSSDDCAGVAFSPTIAAQGAAVLADTTNDRAQMQWVAGDVTSQSMFITFSYQVI